MHQFHKRRDVVCKLTQQSAQINGVGVLWYGPNLILQVVVGVVLADDLDDYTNAYCQWVAAAQHVLDQLLEASLGDKLACKLIGPYHGLILRGCIG